MKQPVDRQANALYDAQFNAFKGTELHAPLSMGECAGFTRTLFDRARTNNYWKADYVPSIVTVDHLPQRNYVGTAYWYADTVNGAYIQLKAEGRRGWVIAHEAAHILLMAGRPMHNVWEGHGKEYAAVYIWAVSALFGKKYSNMLKRAFVTWNVKAVCSLSED